MICNTNPTTWKDPNEPSNFVAASQDCPVKLVVFDFDETLTLATFMTGNCEYADDEVHQLRRPFLATEGIEHAARALRQGDNVII